MGNRRFPIAAAAKALAAQIEAGASFTPAPDSPPCRHCEVSPAVETDIWGLCAGCVRKKRIRAVYQHRTGWTQAWEDWLMLIRKRVAAGEPMFQLGDKKPPLPRGQAGRGHHFKRGERTTHNFDRWADSRMMRVAMQARKRWNGELMSDHRAS